MYRLPGTLFLLALGFAGTAHAQPATLTLACKGTVTHNDHKPQPVSTGIVVNFTTRKVEGFGYPPGVIDFPVRITAADDAMVQFEGSEEDLLHNKTSIWGSIDRVTGDMSATEEFFISTTKDVSLRQYELKCKPTQRMF